MSKITAKITRQGWEYIRDRIAEILADELNAQVTMDYPSVDIDAQVWVERTNSFDKTELPAINVSLATGSWENKNQGSQDGTYIFNIDCYALAKTKGADSGDTLSAIKVQRLLGICRYILEDPIYKTLGFEPPFIMRTGCKDVNIASPPNEDEKNVAMGRITFSVTANEKNQLLVPKLIAGYKTQIKVNGTDEGYLYEGNQYP